MEYLCVLITSGTYKNVYIVDICDSYFANTLNRIYIELFP